MITLKYWNSLSGACRTKVAIRFFGTPNIPAKLGQEYHHSFDFDTTGKMLKTMLSACYLKDNQIEVRCIIEPSFKPKEQPRKIQQPKAQLHRYYFRMYTQPDPEDGETIWEEAYSENEARNKAYDDFHSIVRLDLIRKE